MRSAILASLAVFHPTSRIGNLHVSADQSWRTSEHCTRTLGPRLSRFCFLSTEARFAPGVSEEIGIGFRNSIPQFRS